MFFKIDFSEEENFQPDFVQKPDRDGFTPPRTPPRLLKRPIIEDNKTPTKSPCREVLFAINRVIKEFFLIIFLGIRVSIITHKTSTSSENFVGYFNLSY